MPKIKVTDIDADASTSAKGIVRLTGCLGGTAAAPTVVALRDGGGTDLSIGSLTDGELLKRSGNSVYSTSVTHAQSSSGGLNQYDNDTSGIAYVNPTASLVFNKPSNTVEGDLLLVYLLSNDDPSISPPAGWSSKNSGGLGSNLDQATWDVYYKIATGSETSTYTFTLSPSRIANGLILLVKGANQSTPFNGDAISSSSSQGYTAALTSPSLTTTAACLVLYMYHAKSQLSISLNAQSGSPFYSSLTAPSADYFADYFWSHTQVSAGAVPQYSTTLNVGGDYISAYRYYYVLAINMANWAAVDVPTTTDVPPVKAGYARVTMDSASQLRFENPAGTTKTVGHPIKYKTADESVTSSTALQNDDHLTFAVAANEIWEFDIDAPVTVGTGGIKVSVNAPASPTGFTADMQILDGTSVVAMSRITTADTALENAGALTTGRVKIHGVIENGANAGNVLLRFAQQASDAAATTVKKYSTITYRKIG
jgi:hypothetical protein